ncbi:helix-turn-helix domain-containing protein [Actinomadura parmotrematis]|uniref:Helix-turn-helix domain-containing protein n=1 Tax=Actinomadura parmotrematis TaxID=2864039 RepID=A0ABS7FRI2_9ACTN|nr:helix-turn-helix transcriptional regulator [Actinomadura parmotrematis]MBW8482138.1 helix-turn-helix domain-containing protein [Actinomadura parmotrematis]
MTTTENPARVRFGAELRRLREAAGVTQNELARTLGCSDGWVSTLENGRKLSEASAIDLDTHFGTGEKFTMLCELAAEVDLMTVLPPGFAQYVDHEGHATTLRVFSALLVNGLFQTEDYARAVLEASNPANADALLAKRLDRQKVLTREGLEHVWLTLDERVLRDTIGGREVMRGQLRHLLDASRNPFVSLRVVPQGSGYYEGLEGSFTILGFQESMAHVAYVEATGSGMLFQAPHQVKDFLVRYDLIGDHALTVTESPTLIESILKEL